MNTERILTALRSRGACVHLLDGEHLGIAPASVLTDDLRAEIRAHKSELVQALQAEAPQPTHAPACPADQLGADWRRAMATTRSRFKETGVEPNHETLEAAAWLDLQLEKSLFPRPGISEAAARRLLEAVYSGRLVAGIKDGARVVLSALSDGQQQRLPAPEGDKNE